MDITVFKIKGCGYCVKINELMERAQIEYTTIMVDDEITSEEFKEKFPNASGFPYVIIDGEPVGGLVETVKLFVEKGLVSSRKK
jgi:glutaredoxin 3